MPENQVYICEKRKKQRGPVNVKRKR